MARFSREEVDTEFQNLYRLGCVVEDWAGWANSFTEDARYVEHFWGVMHGRDEILAWIEPVMKGVPEIYTVLEWYIIEDEKVVWSLQNRRDNPDPEGPPYFDFPGLSVATYAGDGLWDYEEDYWDVNGARSTAKAYASAVRRCDPDFPSRMSRLYWPESPDWARLDAPANPTWVGRADVTPVLRPSELGRERMT